eukprot:CAMPEP_0198689040 /NCGR_PEP_ID=MMETSP1468-20131203/126839_1 /TAXON_ID=1461545 /ORGANISM="Mantoniella sp, Strain CCMP1436" /LENGTH=90 /DNA_ID=CAMNT_0044439583 /DNA_START=588 /DNA_END=860 /DNA_ORIENTATION=-
MSASLSSPAVAWLRALLIRLVIRSRAALEGCFALALASALAPPPELPRREALVREAPAPFAATATAAVAAAAPSPDVPPAVPFLEPQLTR